MIITVYTYRVLSQPYIKLRASDDLALGEKISELFQVVRQCLEDGMPAALSCSAAAVCSMACMLAQC